MHQQSELSFYRFRYVCAGILTAAFLLSISALVTSVGAGSILDGRTKPSVGGSDASLAYNSNAITASGYRLLSGTERALLAMGVGVYGGCRALTSTTVATSKAIGHSSTVAVSGIGHGLAATAHGIGTGTATTLHAVGSSVVLTVRLPGKAIGTLTGGHAVSAVLRPADDKPVPVISSQTSAAYLQRFNEQQRQEITSWQAAQLTANQQLGGSLVAGDPNHGGYPAKWDNAPQDSLLDNWGMYSRECVSYAAWKVYQTYGDMPYWGGVGNANQWVGDAKRAGIPTGTTPKVGSVAIWRVGYYGHAMWVEKVSGNMIYVSQYNYDLNGRYSEMWVNGSNFTYIYFK